MQTLVDRLRDAIRPTLTRGEDRAGLEKQAVSPCHVASGVGVAADVLGGEWCTLRGQTFLTVERYYSGGHRHGGMSILDALPPDSGVWSGLPLLVGRSPAVQMAPDGSRRLLFIDLETTGLAGGAGTYAFLVGLAWFEGSGLRVRQFFLSSFGAERAVLEAVAACVADAAAIVTFNGRSFDVPLIDTRFALHRLPTPFATVPHVDMLHPARRFWRQFDASRDVAGDNESVKGGGGCRLTDLERSVCGHERDDDVPGFEIPSRYFHYVRSGDARPLEGVLEHNRVDLISLALLTARAAQLLEDGPAEASTAREALGMGLVYESAGRMLEARAAFARAAGLDASAPDADVVTRAEALRAFAALARRERRFDDAACAWQQALDLADCPPQIARDAAEALAVHHEHRARDLDSARRFAVLSMQYRTTAVRVKATRHRLARLEKKLGRESSADALF